MTWFLSSLEDKIHCKLLFEILKGKQRGISTNPLAPVLVWAPSLMGSYDSFSYLFEKRKAMDLQKCMRIAALFQDDFDHSTAYAHFLTTKLPYAGIWSWTNLKPRRAIKLVKLLPSFNIKTKSENTSMQVILKNEHHLESINFVYETCNNNTTIVELLKNENPKETL